MLLICAKLVYTKRVTMRSMRGLSLIHIFSLWVDCDSGKTYQLYRGYYLQTYVNYDFGGYPLRAYRITNDTYLKGEGAPLRRHILDVYKRQTQPRAWAFTASHSRWHRGRTPIWRRRARLCVRLRNSVAVTPRFPSVRFEK